MKTSYCLFLSIFLFLSTYLRAELPPHASLVPEKPFLLISLHPGQLMQKANHQSLINKPTVASIYSASSSHGILTNLDFEDDGFDEHNALITKLIENPAATTGIDLEQPIFLVFPSISNLELQLIAKLKDPKQFENFLPKLISSDNKWKDTKGGNRAFVEDSNSIIVHDGKSLIAKGAFNRKGKPWIKEVDQWFKGRETKLPKFLSEQLGHSPDAGFYVSMEQLMPFYSQNVGVDQPPPELLKDAEMFYAINSKEGSLNIDLYLKYGEKNILKPYSKPFSEGFFNMMGQDSPLNATLSIDLESYFGLLLKALPFMGLNPEEVAEEIKEAFNIEFKEIPEMFTGQISLSVNGVSLEEEEIDFTAAIGTRIPAAEVYVKIIQKGLLGALRGETPRDNNPLSNLSIVAKENLLLVSSKNHADALESGTVAKPLQKKARSKMQEGLLNLVLNFPKLIKTLEQNNEEYAEDEEFQFVMQRVLPAFDSFGMTAVQTTDYTYKTSYVLTFKDKKSQGLQTLSHHIADLANPYLYHPTNREKILASEAKAAKAPEQYQKDIVGTWSGNFEDEESKNYYMVKVHENGSMRYEEIFITKEDFERHDSKGKWTLQGTTFKDYNESGGLEFVATIVSLNEDTLEYFDYFEFDFYDEEMEPTQEKKVDADYKLPDPPKGLKEYKEVQEE